MDISDRKLRQNTINDLLRNGYTPLGEKGGKGSSIVEAAKILDISASALRKWVEKETSLFIDDQENFVPSWDLYKEEEIVQFETLPPPDIPINEILNILEIRNEKRIENHEAKNWQKISMNTNKPIVVVFVGDPHLDDNGCNLKLLRQHIELMNRPDVYAFNIGDTTNNWTGRLMKLYSEQDTSLETARRLIDWFLNDAGIRWLGWVTGNHDCWEHGSHIIKSMNRKSILIEDWEAKVNITFPSGLEIPIWLAHDFKGSSITNKVHGAVKKAKELAKSCVFVAGHRHDWGYYTEELPTDGNVIHAFRVRGYKYLDHYSIVNGFSSSQHGASAAIVIDPRATDFNSAVYGFTDIEKAIKFKESL